MSLDHAVAQLRHLYSQMIGGDVRYPAEAAKGLLGPAIPEIERAAASRAVPPAAQPDDFRPPLAPWYEADGSTSMLPVEEVTRRRRLAAKVLGAALEAADSFEAEGRIDADTDDEIEITTVGWEEAEALTAAVKAYRAPPVTAKGTTP